MKQLIAMLIVGVGLVLSFESTAQEIYNPEKKFGANELRQDFAILKQVLENVHGGLYRYTPSRTMDSLFVTTYSQIKAPMTEIDFFRLINPLLVAIKDEHTFALPSSQYIDKEIGQTVYSNTASASRVKLFPFFIKLINNRIFIDNNLSNDLSLKTGDEILSINGKSASEVITILLSTIPANGDIQTFRYRHLEQFSLQQTYNRFMVHYAIFIGEPDAFDLMIRKIDLQQPQSVKVNALTSDKIFTNYWRRYSTVNDAKKQRENPLGFSIDQNNTAYLRLSDFHTPIWIKYNYSYSTEFRTQFELIKQKGIKNLIVDLRNNEGGNLTIGVELLKYLCRDTFRPYNYHEVKNYKFPSLKKYFRDSTASPNYPDEMFIATGNNTFRSDPQYKTEAMSRPIQPSPNAFEGSLYVLINGATGSAASILATLIRVNRKDALFIGEESGGDMEGPISGGGTDITLPNTKIRVDIPFVRRVVNLNGYKNEKNRGVIPDHQIAPNLTDLITNSDTELNFTLDLIKRRK